MNIKENIQVLKNAFEKGNLFPYYVLDIKTNKPVCQLSQKIMSELSTWNEKNYFVSDVSIRFIVAWRPKDAPKEEKEHAVLLADLTLNKYVSE